MFDLVVSSFNFQCSFKRDDFCNMAYCSVHERRENYEAVHFLCLSSVCPNFHWVTLVAFVMAVLQKLVLFFLQRPSWQYCAEPRHPHFLLHWTGRANKHINNRWTIRQGWTPFPWGKQAALPLHPCLALSHGKARKHEALEGQNWHRSHRRIAFFQSSKFEYSFAKILLSLTRW